MLPARTSTVQADGQLRNAKEIGEIVVARRNGVPVRLNDLGEVLDDVQDNRVASWYRDQRSITLAVQRQPGTNTVQVAEGVLALLDRLRPQFPASVRHCVGRVEACLRRISGNQREEPMTEPERLLGRLRADLTYSRPEEIILDGLHEFLDSVQNRCDAIGLAITRTYLSY